MKKLKYIKLYETYWNLDDTFNNKEIQLYFKGEKTPRKYYIGTIMPADFYVGLTKEENGGHSIGITYISRNHPKWNKYDIGKWFEYDMLNEKLGVEVAEQPFPEDFLTKAEQPFNVPKEEKPADQQASKEKEGLLPQIVNHCKWNQ